MFHSQSLPETPPSGSGDTDDLPPILALLLTPIALQTWRLILLFGVLLFDSNDRVTAPIPVACCLLLIGLQTVQHYVARHRDARILRTMETHVANVERTRAELQLVYSTIACGIVVRDKHDRIVIANAEAQRILNLTDRQLLGTHGSQRPYALTDIDGAAFPPDQIPSVVALRTGKPVHRVAGVLRHDNVLRYVRLDAIPLPAGGDNKVVVSFVDISDELAAVRAVAANEERYRSIVELAHDGIWLLDADNKTTFVNRRLAELLGYSEAAMIGRPIGDFLAPAVDHADSRAEIWRPEISGQYDATLRHQDGTSLRALVATTPFYDHHGSYAGSLAMVADITARKLAEDALKHQALYDSLTDLPNRAMLDGHLEGLLAGGEPSDVQHAVLVLGIGRFRDINNTFGHSFGDDLLRQIAQRLAGAMPVKATYGRLAGDEFAVILPQSDILQTLALANLLHAVLQAPFTISQQTIQCSASIGTALFPDDGRDAATLLRHAGVAMYSAKRNQSGTATYDPAQDSNSPGRLALIADLRQALDLQTLDVYYQPQASMFTNQVESVEALMRWSHPTLGCVAPDQFIPLAEGNGLVGLLTRYVLNSALAQCRIWHDAGRHIAVSVNLSSWNLHDPGLPDTVASALALHQVPPGLLRLEITESAVMNDPERAANVLIRLADMGIEISVDDYGTGYSSLDYLKRLPVTEIKIDKGFVMEMGTHPADAIIVASTIGLGHSLGLRVVAEGVEDQETWDTLATLGCDTVQGYLLSRPMPATELLAWLDDRAGTVAAHPRGVYALG